VSVAAGTVGQEGIGEEIKEARWKFRAESGKPRKRWRRFARSLSAGIAGTQASVVGARHLNYCTLNGLTVKGFGFPGGKDFWIRTPKPGGTPRAAQAEEWRFLAEHRGVAISICMPLHRPVQARQTRKTGVLRSQKLVAKFGHARKNLT
jgi:hypothetical protein